MKSLPLRNSIGLAGLFAVLSGGLAGCCGSIDCDACDAVSPNDVFLAFDKDSLQAGFRKAELSLAYAVRYARPGFITPLDTVRLFNRNNPVHYFRVSLYELTYRNQSAGQSKVGPLSEYNYRLVLPAANRAYDISEVKLKVKVGEGCCACSYNQQRRFLLNGQPVVADGSALTVLRR